MITYIKLIYSILKLNLFLLWFLNSKMCLCVHKDLLPAHKVSRGGERRKNRNSFFITLVNIKK